MPLAVNDVLEMTVGGIKDGNTILNIFHFQCTVAPSTGSPAENVNAFITHLWDDPGGLWFDEWLAVMPTDWTFRFVRCQRVAPTRLAYVEVAQAVAGLAASPAIPTANLAWVFVKQSELAGRRGVGPVHMLLPSADWMTDGELNLTEQDSRTDLMNLMPNTIVVTAGGTYAPIIYHPGFSPNFTRITHVTQKQQIRTMRRRTVGRGI